MATSRNRLAAGDGAGNLRLIRIGAPGSCRDCMMAIGGVMPIMMSMLSGCGVSRQRSKAKSGKGNERGDCFHGGSL